jgi:23S rRNA (guanosine2251-2'-O)-methyltransferase
MAKKDFLNLPFLEHPYLIKAQFLYLEHHQLPPTGKLSFLNDEETKLKPLLTQAQELNVAIRSLNRTDWIKFCQKHDFKKEIKIVYEKPQIPFFECKDKTSFLELTPVKPGLRGVILDQIQDPQNFGAILRSAAFFGLNFCVVTFDHQSPITSAVAKASSGGVFGVKIILVSNLKRALQDLKTQGFWIVGSALGEDVLEHQISQNDPLVCVLGNENQGLRQGIKRECDWNIEIPCQSMYLDSLNVASAGSILFEKLSQFN